MNCKYDDRMNRGVICSKCNFWVYSSCKRTKAQLAKQTWISRKKCCFDLQLINKIENKITFKFKTGYYLELLTPETMKLLGSTKSKITKDNNAENVPYSEINEVVLIHCNAVNNNYQQDSRVLYVFVPMKCFGHVSRKIFLFLKTFDSEFPYIEVWFTDQNSRPLEIEDKIKVTLVIN